VWTAIRPNSRSLATSQGKGIDHPSAKASALMESIECWHAERARGVLRHESPEALASEGGVVDVDALPRVRRAPISRNAPVLWIEGWDLLADRRAWVPYECVSLNFVAGDATPPPSFAMSSNGLASGNDRLEAIAHALGEVIERDATASAEREGDATRRRVDLATVDDDVCAELLERIARAGLEVCVWDQTSRAGVPTYAASIFEAPSDARWRRVGGAAGHGSHLDPSVALARALSEAVQTRLTVISGSRDDLLPSQYRRAASFDSLERKWRLASSEAAAVSARAHTSRATDSFEGDVAQLLAALRTIGIEQAVVVDLTREDIGVPVVKVIVPGLDCGGGAPRARGAL
jgi:ribosomal protein S12 methylthiotransferase accessory factor